MEEQLGIYILSIILIVALGALYYCIKSKKNLPLAIPESDQLKAVSIEEVPDQLIIGDIDAPIIQIRRFPETTDGNYEYEELSLSDEIKIGLTNIMQQAPMLAVNAKNMFGNTYKVVFSPEVVVGFQDGTCRLMNSRIDGVKAVAVDSASNKIKEIGNIRNMQFNPAATALVIWQVAAIITAQKFLADIEQRLRKIENGINDIKKWLEAEETGKIMHFYEYLKDLAQIIKNHKLTPVDIQTSDIKLEDIEMECGQLMKSIGIRRESSLNEIEKIKTKVRYKLKAPCEEMKKHVVDYSKDIEKYLMAFSIRVMAAQLKGCLPVNRHKIGMRLDALKDNLYDNNEYLKKFSKKVELKISKLHGTFRRSKQEKQCKEDMGYFLNCEAYKIKQYQEQIQPILVSLKNSIIEQINESQRPISLEITLSNNNQVEKARKMLPLPR